MHFPPTQMNVERTLQETPKRSLIPWWAKLFGKIALSRLPIPYRIWANLNLFKHGRMRQTGPALRNFERHYGKIASSLPQAFSVLEMGPGDSVSTGVIAAAHGASRSILIDVGRFADESPETYRALAEPLRKAGLEPPRLPDTPELEGILEACRCSYLTRGLESYKTIPSASVDFIFSTAVLEHVFRNEFEETIRQTRRILKPGGYCSHLVDLQDHLEGSLNNLRFPAGVWESSLFRNSGFYTNRLRYSEMLAVFERNGFRILSVREVRWPKLPLRPGKFDASFRAFAEDEMRIAGFDILMIAE